MRRPAGVCLIPVLLLLPALAAAADETAIPSHPAELSYPELRFEVPDADAHRHRLASGVVAYVVEDHDLPLVKLDVLLRGGSFLEPQDKVGLAFLTGSMLRRGGAGDLSAEEFDQRADFLAAELSSYSGELQSGARLDCLSRVLDDCLGLFFDMLKHPRFQEDRLQVEKGNLLEQMKQRNDHPQSILSREWQWLLYGTDHFSSRKATQRHLDAIGRDDLVRFHRRTWRPEEMILAAAGAVESADFLAKLEAHFADWPGGEGEIPWPPPAPDHRPRPGLYYVEKDIPQGRIHLGHLGAQRRSWDDPDAFALELMNDILGGSGFTSRLVQRIRSDEGLAYSVRSSFGVGLYWPSDFVISFQSKNATVALATQIALEEVERLRREPVSAEELAVAKSYLIESFPRRFESAARIGGTFADDELYDRPHAYWTSYRGRIRQVSAADIQRVAQRYLQPERLVLLVVGNWEEIGGGDADGRASMGQFFDGEARRLPLRDPLTLEPRP